MEYYLGSILLPYFIDFNMHIFNISTSLKLGWMLQLYKTKQPSWYSCHCLRAWKLADCVFARKRWGWGWSILLRNEDSSNILDGAKIILCGVIDCIDDSSSSHFSTFISLQCNFILPPMMGGVSLPHALALDPCFDQWRISLHDVNRGLKRRLLSCICVINMRTFLGQPAGKMGHVAKANLHQRIAS